MEEQQEGGVEIDSLQRHLLAGSSSSQFRETHEDVVLYSASFAEMENNFVKYQAALWIFFSVLLLLAWGVGLFLLLYLPVRIHIIRRDFRSRKLFVTSSAIVYKVGRPVAFPCLGVHEKERHVVLPSVGDVIVEQGYVQSLFGIYSLRIKSAALRRPAGDDLRIEGISNPREFQEAVLMHLSSIRSHGLVSNSQTDFPQVHLTRDIIFQKLEEVENSVKRVHSLIKEA